MELENIQAPEASYFTNQQMDIIMDLLDQEVIELKNSFSTSIKYKKLSDDERDKRQSLRLLDIYARRLFVHLAYVTGARRGEIVSTTWSQLDNECYEIEFNGTSYTLAGEPTKKKPTLKNGSRKKVVPFSDGLIPMINEYKRLQAKVRRQQGWPRNDYIFLATHNGKVCKAGGPMRGDTMTHWFHDWCNTNRDKIGIDEGEGHVHMLRHSFVTFGISNGVSLKILGKMVGHSSTQVTDKIYAHVTPDAARGVANMFGARYTKEAVKTEEKTPKAV